MKLVITLQYTNNEPVEHLGFCRLQGNTFVLIRIVYLLQYANENIVVSLCKSVQENTYFPSCV